jgi:hypothetical protein
MITCKCSVCGRKTKIIHSNKHISIKDIIYFGSQLMAIKNGFKFTCKKCLRKNKIISFEIEWCCLDNISNNIKIINK